MADSKKRWFLLVAGLLNATCSEPSLESDASYFFVDHVHRAEVSVDGKTALASSKELSDLLTLRYETRRVLTPPIPSQVVFDLQIPKNPLLRFAIAASSEGQRTLLAPVEFRVLIEAGDREELVFEHTVRRSQPDRWITHEVDLSSWTGRDVRLSFETRLGRGGVASAERYILPVWGNPVLVSQTSPASTSNLILISVDCLRADHLGAYGYDRDTSPRIDAFSREAVLFRTAIATSSYTLPTHASMLTGQPPSLHGADRLGISATVPYLPQLLAEAGYRVNGAVSAPFLAHSYGFHRGFHTYRNVLTRAEAVVDSGVALLHEGAGQNQFLFLHLMDAHWTYSPPKEFITRFGDRPPDISGLLDLVGRSPSPSQSELEQIINLYDAEIAYLDEQIGRLFDELKRMGLYDNALIILTADHGEAFLEHGQWEHSRPWRHDGPGLFEEVIHVPLIVKWPGETVAAEIPSVVSQVDIFPTLLSVAGGGRPESWAIDLRRYLDGGYEAFASRKVIAELTSRSADGGTQMKIAFRSQEAKYIATLRSPTMEDLFSSAVEKEQLYDLRDDPHEAKNLIPESGHLADGYRKALQVYLLEAKKRYESQPGVEITLDDRVLEELRTLGYIER